MAGSPRALLWWCLWLSCSLVAEGSGERPGGLGQRSVGGGRGVGGRRSRAAEAEAEVEQPAPSAVVPAGDKVSEHMLRLYVRYSGRAQDSEAPGTSRLLHLQEGNTVRSFRALPPGESEGAARGERRKRRGGRAGGRADASLRTRGPFGVQ